MELIKVVSKEADGGGAMRHSIGGWLIGLHRNIGRCSTIQAELHAMLDGFLMAWDQGIRHVEVEIGDSEVVRILKTSS
ncbi:hypothetical protein F3Y22_tig00112507pilonHSYRG00047 [Hibiscus syriacus]|uniref:RNase H type-1 domain-containing protein n=1 Tax=Hibiscus syriacus TaxID=106335 RepID=A0A6A2Y695_HIBSY|nr:hypothetical protein F3Y22_tig00112507pilonHSYRG00047 [Hibiscus syriacus]